MPTWNQLKEDVQQSLQSIADGWRALWQRAANALTHFTPGKDEDTAMTPFRWGVVAAELIDHPDRLELSVEVPGLDKDDISVEVVDRRLVIRGEKRTQRESTSGHYIVSERAYGQFQRSIALPCDVDPANVKAKYRHGVLAISLAKSQPTTGRSITIDWD